jgi:hypothetical protein
MGGGEWPVGEANQEKVTGEAGETRNRGGYVEEVWQVGEM